MQLLMFIFICWKLLRNFSLVLPCINDKVLSVALVLTLTLVLALLVNRTLDSSVAILILELCTIVVLCSGLNNISFKLFLC